MKHLRAFKAVSVTDINPVPQTSKKVKYQTLFTMILRFEQRLNKATISAPVSVVRHGEEQLWMFGPFRLSRHLERKWEWNLSFNLKLVQIVSKPGVLMHVWLLVCFSGLCMVPFCDLLRSLSFLWRRLCFRGSEFGSFYCGIYFSPLTIGAGKIGYGIDEPQKYGSMIRSESDMRAEPA